jgi:hypothetical protein
MMRRTGLFLQKYFFYNKQDRVSGQDMPYVMSFASWHDGFINTQILLGIPAFKQA